MSKLKRILPFRILVLVFLLLITKTEGTINASIDNFYMNCGTRNSGQMDISYNNSNYQTIASMYINNKPIECSFVANGTIYNIVGARKRGCAVQDLTSPYLSYHAIVFLQEDRWFQRATDPKFLLSCVYTSGDVKVKTSPISILDTTWNVQDYRWNVVRGYVDMSYQLGIYEDDGFYNQSILQAQFGQNMALKVSMSGTDQDEKGIRVRECVARSGGMEAQFIKNYCSSSAILPPNAGFISNGTHALLTGVEAFRLAGSEDLTVTFECLVDVCAENCDGENCRSHIRTKRDASNIQQNVSQVQAFGKINIIGFDQLLTPVVTSDNTDRTGGIPWSLSDNKSPQVSSNLRSFPLLSFLGVLTPAVASDFSPSTASGFPQNLSGNKPPQVLSLVTTGVRTPKYAAPSENWCINQLEFIVPITCLSCVLCFTLYALICIITRRHKTSNAKVENIE